ncbi:MAG: MBL fold metallo-hydrolase [Bacteroidales bacterium]
MNQYKTFTFNPLGVNTTIVWSGTRGLIFDPACHTDEEFEILNQFIEKNNIQEIDILQTHAHFDHLMGVNAISSKYTSSLKMHKDDLFLLENAVAMAARFGILMDEVRIPDEYLDESKTINIGDEIVSLLHVPGHSPGSLCYHFPTSKIIIVGDVLFRGSIGRTDLPGGDMRLLVNGIQSKLLTLPEDTVVISGHGASTSIGDEKRTNPFIQ